MDFGNLNTNNDNDIAGELLNKKNILLKTELNNLEIQKMVQLQFVSDYFKQKGLKRSPKVLNKIMNNFACLRVSHNRQGRKEFGELLKKELDLKNQETMNVLK